MSDEPRIPQFPTVIDSSMLSSYSCPLQFFYKYCLNLTPYQKSIHLHAGGAFADAVQAVRLAYFRDNLDFEQSMFAGMRAFIKYWGQYEPDAPTYKDFYNVLAAVFDYFHTYHPATDHIRPFRRASGDPAVEFTFAIPLPVNHPVTGEPLLYAGRCDMVGVYSSLNCIVDEKTTYSFSDNWVRQFVMRAQFMGYCYAAQQYGIKTNTAVIRGVAIQQRAIKHQEAIIQFPQWQIERWYEEMVRKATNLVDWYSRYIDSNKDIRVWPMSYGDACTSYSGCEMLDLCTSENPANWFSTFSTRNWNPLIKDPTSETEVAPVTEPPLIEESK